jgi:hypothetical protein
MKAYYKGKELYQTINRDGYILAPNGEVLKLRKNGKRVVRIDGEYVKASTVVKPTILREARLVNPKVLGELYKENPYKATANGSISYGYAGTKYDIDRFSKEPLVICKNDKYCVMCTDRSINELPSEPKLDRHFPSAKGAIKLATLIITTLILCMFVVLAWVVTKIFGSV